MELKDFVVTPIVLFIVYILAYIIRPKVTDHNTRRYFIPALTVKIIGAIAVGLVYQFYYGGGDTFAFHTHGSRVIWEAFHESFDKGVRLLLSNGDYSGGGYFSYASRIWYYKDPHSFFVIRVAAVFDLITFSTYSATAVLFACFSFSGMWVLFITFQRKYEEIHFWFALSILFAPSVFFWGSGILKDTITLGCLAWMTYLFDELFIRLRLTVLKVGAFVAAASVVYIIKVYILLSFLPALILWFFVNKILKIRSFLIRVLLAPLLFATAGVLGYYTVLEVSKNNTKYSIDNLAKTAQITAYDIRYGWGARDGAGAGYTLGELDGTLNSIIGLAPQAINVSLFRPYIWEIQNPLMVLSAFEAFMFLLLTVGVVFKTGLKRFLRNLFQPDIIFCLTFSLIFALAVGISTYNFGSLSRYKIPLIPFYLTGLTILYYHSDRKSDKKLAELDLSE